MTKEVVEKCTAEGEYCTKCQEEKCNGKTITPRNGAIANAAISQILLIIGAVHIYFLF